MVFNYFSRNGQILPSEMAKVDLSNIEYSYGFGVYETLRVKNGVIYFLDDHICRLINSASIIGLEHEFDTEFIKKSVSEVIAKVQASTCNVKILLIGGKTSDASNLYIMCLNPLFPDRKLYKNGVSCITVNFERVMPGAKTLNMLQSYLAYKKAKQAQAYEALLIDSEGCIVEGTRTNFFGLAGKTIYTAKEDKILLGVTRSNVLKVARQNGFEVMERNIKLAEIGGLDGAFLTSTSTKIMPIRSIDSHVWESIPPELFELISGFDQFLAKYAKNNQL